MPEELNILPCPACGGTATEVSHTQGHVAYRVTCSDCFTETYAERTSVEAVAVWNALPRALTWTTDTPKVAGRYWCRYKGDSKEAWSIAYIPAVTDWNKRDMKEHDRIEWAGPIPAPKEPTP